jgi:hypothetical protein
MTLGCTLIQPTQRHQTLFTQTLLAVARHQHAKQKRHQRPTNRTHKK